MRLTKSHPEKCVKSWVLKCDHATDLKISFDIWTRVRKSLILKTGHVWRAVTLLGTSATETDLLSDAKVHISGIINKRFIVG